MLTNEEKRILIYNEVGTYTRPETVTPDTPLESLNLNWTEKDMPQKERTKHVHGLHPYLGKFIPQLVEVFLRKYFAPGDKVLDPFSGSGTALVQANELGIHSIGFDISAFNVLLNRVKTQEYDIKKLRKEIFDILEKTEKNAHKGPHQLSLWDNATQAMDICETSNEYLQSWYSSRALSELLTYRQLLETEKYEYQDVLKIILSRSARSARQTTHFDLDFPKQPQKEPYWCYKHSRTCYPVDEALKFIQRYSYDTFRRIKEFSTKRTQAYVHIEHTDSRNADIPLIDGVITSPPYVGLIDYHEQHVYAYHLLGLQDNRCQEIGPAANGSSVKAKERYQKDIADVFRNALSAMKRGGYMIIVAGDRYGLYHEIAANIGVEVEGILNRHVNRRTGRRSSEFYESIFIWRKI